MERFRCWRHYRRVLKGLEGYQLDAGYNPYSKMGQLRRQARELAYGDMPDTR
jgi:hypothetical protein